MKAEVFSEMPNELKTIEIDTRNKIFRINGEDFGERCIGFNIHCDATEGFMVRMNIDADILFVSKYNLKGEKLEALQKKGQQGIDLNDV